MNDDRTEQALRRALDDAARHVDVPMARLPEPSPVPANGPRRRPTVVTACIAAVVVLAAGSIIVLAARDDGTSSIQVGAAVDGSPIGAADADVDVYLDDDTLDADVEAVRSFLESTPDVTAYTYVTTDQALAERQALKLCASGVVGSLGGPEFRLRVGDAAPLGTLAEHLASMRAVTRVQINPNRPSPDATTVVPTTPDASSTTAAPTTLPTTTTLPPPTSVPAPTTSVVEAPTPTTTTATAATDAPTSTAPSSTAPTTSAPSKEIPFVLPAPAQCPSVQTTPVPTAVGGGAPPGPAATLPPAGDQPSDPATAEQAIRDMWTYTHDGSVPLEDRFRDHLEDAEVLLPLMKSIGRDDAVQTTQILGVQFVSPTRAAVLSRNVFQGGALDVAQVQYVVLLDGQWKWTRESECKAVARAGVHCPEGP